MEVVKFYFPFYILRYKPVEYEIVLVKDGYTNVDELINKLNAHNENISLEILQYIIDTNNKKRFAFNDDLTKIRASQGHSIDIQLDCNLYTAIILIA